MTASNVLVQAIAAGPAAHALTTPYLHHLPDHQHLTAKDQTR